MEKNNKTKSNKVLFIVLIVVAVLIYMIPTIFIVGNVVYSIFDKTEFKEEGNNIIVENGKVNLINISSYYDNDTNEYIIYGYINNTDKDYTIDLTFDVYDANNFIIGQAFANLEMEKNEKYKFKAVYYESDAQEIVSYKLNNINLY